MNIEMPPKLAKVLRVVFLCLKTSMSPETGTIGVRHRKHAALATFLFSGYVNAMYGIAGALFCFAGHYIGFGMVIKNGSKIVRPVIILVLILLFVKILS